MNSNDKSTVSSKSKTLGARDKLAVQGPSSQVEDSTPEVEDSTPQVEDSTPATEGASSQSGGNTSSGGAIGQPAHKTAIQTKPPTANEPDDHGTDDPSNSTLDDTATGPSHNAQNEALVVAVQKKWRAKRGLKINTDLPPLFFVHLMKTAGTSLFWNLRDVVGIENVCPHPASTHQAYYDIPGLLALDSEKFLAAKVIVGHFPFYIASELPMAVEVATVLRDPVERTISLLKEHRINHGSPEEPLEAIYEYPNLMDFGIANHQSKLFSMRREDNPVSFMTPVAVDEERLAQAKANLETVTYLGTHDTLDHFSSELASRFGYSSEMPAMRVSAEQVTISDSFRRRIIEDNAMDMEFYEFGRGLVEERRRKPNPEKS